MLTVLIVNWNVRELLAACLRSLHAHAPASRALRIVVVDNASTDGSVEMLRHDFPGVLMLANAQNRGFTGGNNDGLERIHTMQPPNDYVLLLNPDTEVRTGTLDTLLAFMNANPDVGVCGPRMFYGDGSAQSSARSFPTLLTAMFESTWLQSYAPRTLLDHFYRSNISINQPSDVDWLVGAALLVRAKAIDQVGGLDEQNFFMYSEELDWCRRIKSAGWRIVYVPSASLTHFEGRSSEQASANRMTWFNSSKVRYFRKHHSPAQAATLKLWLMGQFAWQTAQENIKRRLGNKPQLRSERVRAYRQVITALWRA